MKIKSNSQFDQRHAEEAESLPVVDRYDECTLEDNFFAHIPCGPIDLLSLSLSLSLSFSLARSPHFCLRNEFQHPVLGVLLRQKWGERERESVCVCVCVCVRERV